MHWRIETFWTEKAGNHPEDYEDAAAYEEEAASSLADASFPEGSLRVCVADGAAGGFESRLWAKALVETFVHNPVLPETELLREWLLTPSQIWNESIHWERLKYYHQEKARSGAFATFIGAVFEPIGVADSASDAGLWHALAVGDACLFQVCCDELVASFPLQASEEFDTSPILLSTKPLYNEQSLRDLAKTSGSYALEDRFFLATDALAQWFLREVEESHKPWHELDALNSKIFPSWIAHLRSEKLIRNDDITLIRCHLVDNLDAQVTHQNI